MQLCLRTVSTAEKVLRRLHYLPTPYAAWTTGERSQVITCACIFLSVVGAYVVRTSSLNNKLLLSMLSIIERDS